MVYPDTFSGYAVTDTNKWSTTTKIEYTPKPFGDHDVDIKIEACGVCGSDVHTACGGWSKPKLPVIVGHEIVGTVLRVGSKVTTLKVGDRAGVGAQSWACLECDVCKEDNECYCPNRVSTYNAKYKDGSVAQGGYASHARVHEYFTFPIPDGLDSEAVAPMLCAGITVYSPLVRNGCGPGKKVGVIGIGGLGHFAIMFAKALGAEVYAFSRNLNKKEDAVKLGADHYIPTDSYDYKTNLKFKLDLIISCSNSSSMDLDGLISTLRVGGKFVSVGLPEEPFVLSPFTCMNNGSSIGSSHLGNRPEMLQMLDLAVKKDLKAWYKPVSINEEGVKEALEGCHQGRVKYRYTLTNYDKVFK